MKQNRQADRAPAIHELIAERAHEAREIYARRHVDVLTHWRERLSRKLQAVWSVLRRINPYRPPPKRVSLDRSAETVACFRVSTRLWLLLAAVLILEPNRVFADREHVIVIISPPFRASSQPQPIFLPQPPLQWAPPVALGLTPGIRSPTARCYAELEVCPLADPQGIGEPCTCVTAGATQRGRGLIPPSRDFAGRQLKTD